MPELPEVEHFKKYFNRTSTGKKIANITCKDGKLLKGGTLKKINSELDGKSFKPATRRGKFLIAEVTGSPYKVVFHFGMTGYFHYKKKKDAPEENLAKVIFEFSNGDELQWIDQRKFGRVYAVQDIDTIKTLKNMGPEALKISSSAWSLLLKENAAKNIKAFLLDQDSIAGIGNNYSNEMLFQAGINPHAKISALTSPQRTRLHTVMRQVLKKAIGFPLSHTEESYPASWLLDHRTDMKCPKDKNHKLKRATIAGRTAIFCPEHQK